jgi:hypothetical protein
MARKVRHTALESRSARLKLKIRRRPYSGPSLARGISLMYRRNKTNGTWVLKSSDGHGAYWTKGFALADDFEDSDGKTVLTFYQAQDAAKKLARGEDGSAETAPITLDIALKDYKRDLEARSANPYNAEHPRLHLSGVLLSKPVALLTATELKKWRDGLLGRMKPSTINRTCRCICAALALAAQHDDRIRNSRRGKLASPDCRTRRKRAMSFSLTTKSEHLSAGPMRSTTSSDYSWTCWRLLARGRAKPSGCASRIYTITRRGRNCRCRNPPRAAGATAARRKPSATRCRSPSRCRGS